MRLLLDTRILLWWLADDRALPRPAAEAIADPANEVLVSAATAWEVAIKRAAGKLKAPADLPSVLQESHLETLAITVAHALQAGALPSLHVDPFDRMLVAQAQLEALTLVSMDGQLASYDVAILPLDR